jgi:hypothetical protein
MPEAQNRLDTVSKAIQVVSVMVGVVISVLSFNAAQEREVHVREKEVEAKLLELERYKTLREDEDRKRQVEAAKPFLALRQERYMEAVQAAAVLANPYDHTPEELEKARKRFRQLYVAELSMVEAFEVETAMKNLAQSIDPELLKLTPAQEAAYTLAHALRDSLVNSWRVKSEIVANVTGSR